MLAKITNMTCEEYVAIFILAIMIFLSVTLLAYLVQDWCTGLVQCVTEYNERRTRKTLNEIRDDHNTENPEEINSNTAEKG